MLRFFVVLKLVCDVTVAALCFANAWYLSGMRRLYMHCPVVAGGTAYPSGTLGEIQAWRQSYLEFSATSPVNGSDAASSLAAFSYCGFASLRDFENATGIVCLA